MQIVRCFLNIREKQYISGVALAIFVILSPSIALAQSKADSTTVQSIVERYQKVWDTHDANELAQFFTEDADFIMGTWPHISGRKAIQGLWQAYFKKQEPGRKLRLDINSFKIITDAVMLINVSTTTWGHDEQGEELQSRKFRGTWVLNKQSNGDWLIVAMLGLPTEEDRIIRPSDH